MEATKSHETTLELCGDLSSKIWGAFPPKCGGLSPQNLRGLTPEKKTKKQKKRNPPLGFEPKCAAAVLPKHTMYNYSDQPCSIFHTLRLAGPDRAPSSSQRRASSYVQFFPPAPPHNGLRIGLGAVGGFRVFPPRGPTARAGYRRHGLRSRRSTSCQGSTVPAGGF